TVIDYVAKPSDTCISPRLGNVLVLPDVIDDQHHLDEFGRVWYNRNSFPHIDDVEGPTGLIRSDLSSYRTNFNLVPIPGFPNLNCNYINNDGELNYICNRREVQEDPIYVNYRPTYPWVTELRRL